jgi:hypothetical protein
MDKVLNPPAIHGPVIPGEAQKTRKQLEKVINLANSSMFDIGELLFKIKKNGYYEGFDSFPKYLKSLNFKYRRLEYLTKMVECMDAVGIERAKYEPLGIAKLRLITSLNPNEDWVNPETKEVTPIKAFIEGFVEQGDNMTWDEINKHVKTLKGEVGDDAMGWVHIYAKQLAIDNVIKPAFEKMKMLIGSVAKDDDGNSKDASDGSALEKICVNFLLEPVEGYEIPNPESNVDIS